MSRTQNTYKEAFKIQVADYLKIEPENVFLFWRGRVALYAILKALGIKENDEVILPAFTCVVAVNPIIYLRARAIYVDIDPKTYNIDASKIEDKVTPKTKVILAQNTFGLAPDLDVIFEIANTHNLTVIEDCAQGFGGFYKEKPNGTMADASFFSTQWNKPFSTGLGGIAVIRGEAANRLKGKKDERIEGLRGKLEEMEEGFIKPSKKEQWMLRILMFVREHFLNSNTYWFALKTYRCLSQHNLVLGSSQGEELKKPIKPKDFEKGFLEGQAKKGIKEVKNFNKVLEHRRKIANIYKAIFKELGVEPPYEPEYAIHTYLRFPLLVKDRKKFFVEAEKEKIELGDWFLSPVHPIRKNLEYWHYKWGESPIAEKISQCIINLPTHIKITEDRVNKIAQFLRRNRNNIYDSTKKELVKE